LPEEMSKTSRTNKKQGKMRLRDDTNIIKPTCSWAHLTTTGAAKTFKNQLRSFFRRKSVYFCRKYLKSFWWPSPLRGHPAPVFDLFV
jgi:hypothetical protein